MEHAMIDLETLGTAPGSVIMSIAAVTFDLDTGEIGDTFEVNIDMESSQEAGLKIDPRTLQWWMKQDTAVMNLMFITPVQLRFALNQFEFFLKHKEVRYLWGNSASFDLGLLSAAMRAVKMKQPWSHYDERCFRTMRAMFMPDDVYQMYKKLGEGHAHDPVFDCKLQIEQLYWIKQNLNKQINGENKSEEQQKLPGWPGIETGRGHHPTSTD